MEKDIEIRILGLQGKNEFLDFFNVFSYKYSEILDKLGYQDLDNLVEIVRNKIYDMALGYEVECENFFFCSLSGEIIIQMFKHTLENEYNRLVNAYHKLENRSYIGRFIYYFRNDNWIVEYKILCEFCKCFEIQRLEDEFFQAFINVMSVEPFFSRRDDYIRSFKIELRYLTGNDELSNEVDKRLVKSIGGNT